ncbi:MAG TPA: LysM peptidoglycan-binding domain-containing protein [Candidatus Polarisedimenticolaceae bacterium]|nr:LysM peptidoglycan-binding domain-containing protein [Candidatus Polarisedimenticolaceae bacterium]
MLMRRWTIALVAATLIGGTAQAAPPAPDPLFPCPDELREGVDFWKNVWAKWTLDQVVLHDMEHPSIVYEIFELPPPVGDVYTDSQKDFVRARREALESRLAAIEDKVLAGLPLEDDEKAIVLRITEVAGGNGLSGASERVRSQRGLRERFRRGLEISGRYRDAFIEVFREAGLPEDLANLPHVESSFQVSARSSAGAVGVWQFTRGAARKFMLLTSGVDERLDPVASARGAARYLKSAYELLGSWPLAITSYNHGIEGMQAARDRFGEDFPRILAEYDGRTFGFASKNFYKEFLAAREIASDPAAYFPETLEVEPPLDHDTVTLQRPTAAVDVARRYGVSLDRLAAINPAWTLRALHGRAPLPAGVRVWLPEGTLDRIAAAGHAAPAPQARTGVHVVRKGETLFRIATNYGVSLARLLDANGLHRQSAIHPGQQLRIP